MNYNLSSYSRKEIIVMMAFAYCKECHVDNYELNHLLEGFVSHNDIITIINKLKNGNILDKNSVFYYDNKMTLPEGFYIRLLKLLMTPENQDIYNAISNRFKETQKDKYPAPEVRTMLTLIDENCREAYKTSLNLFGCVEEISSVILEKEFSAECEKLQPAFVQQIMPKALDDSVLYNKKLDWEYIDLLAKKNLYAAENKSLINLYAFYRFLGTGDIVIDIEKTEPDMFSLQIAAIDQMYKHNYEDAFKLYAKAMTFSNYNAPEKGIFVNPISNFYYAIAAVLSGTNSAIAKLETMAKKKSVNTYLDYQVIIIPLYTFFCKKEKCVPVTGQMRSYLNNSRYDTTPKWLGWMVMKRIGCLDESLENTMDEFRPNAAFLKKELLFFDKLTNEEAESIKDKYGDKGGLESLPIKSLWKMNLESIIADNNEKASYEDGDKKTKKLEYHVSYNNIVPILKKRTKNGKWSSGRTLNLGSFIDLENEDFLQECDRKLIRNIDPWDYDIDVNVYIWTLAGCDHIYLNNNYNLEPISVHKDKPYLIIDKNKDGSFSVSSNYSPGQWDDQKHFVVKNSNTDYSVLSPSDYEKSLYRQVLNQKVYPAEAEPLLMQMISKIGGKTEIHSNMVVELDDIEKADADTKVTVRCVPMKDGNISLNIMVRPYGNITEVPGQGNITTIAEKDGKKVQVSRNLKKEKKNLALVREAMMETGILDDFDNKWEPDSTNDAIETNIELFLPLLEWLNNNKNTCIIEWPEGEHIKYHPNIKSKSASITFKSKNSWFEVEGDVKIDDKQVISLNKLLELMHGSESRFIKIGDNEYIKLTNDLTKMLKRLDSVTSEQRQHLQMAPSAVGLIGELLDNQDIKVKNNSAITTLRKRIEESSRMKPKVPKKLKAELRDYQEEGFSWMSKVTSWGGGVCLADDMGLGKTLQTITLLLEQNKDGASIVVAPASVVPNWRNEISRFAPSLNVIILNTCDDRSKAIKDAKEGDVVLATYAMLTIQKDELTEKEWNVLCLDEAHTIKNPETKMSKAAMKMQAKRKIILTGTPIQNHLSELWNLFQFINPGLLGSAEQFKKKYIMPIEEDQNKERQKQLKRLISPFLLRRTKNDVIEELPEKNEIYLPVELSSDEMTMYEVTRKNAENAVKEDDKNKLNAITEITRLRQMACSCSLVDKKWKKTSSKVEAFVELAESLNDSGNRALVFSQFTSFFEQIKKALDKAGIPYLYLDGSTPIKQREQLVRDFQNGDCPFFLISLKAGGLGLNLTGANYVIHLDPWWNPAIEQQATDRAYRIGQTQNVTVYHFISQHTIEEKIIRLHKTKRDLADSLLEGSDMAHALTQEELLELLSEE